MFRKNKNITPFLLSLALIAGAFAGWPVSVEAAQNITVGDWSNFGSIIYLNDNDDELIIDTSSSPASPVEILVTASDGSEVTIKSLHSIMYPNIHITVVNKNITLNLDNLSFKAPDGKCAIMFSSKDTNDTLGSTIDVTGDCMLEGGDKTSSTSSENHGIRSYAEDLIITGNGTLTARGGAAIHSSVSQADHGINTAKTLTIQTDVVAEGGDGTEAEAIGGIGIYAFAGLYIESGNVTAAGGSGKAADRVGNVGIRAGSGPMPGPLVISTSGKVAATGGYTENGYGIGGIMAYDLTVTSGAVVEAYYSGGPGNPNLYEYAIYAYRNVLVDNAHVYAYMKQADKSQGSSNYSLFITGDLTVKGGGSVTAYGGDNDVQAGGNGLWVQKPSGDWGEGNILVKENSTVTAYGADGLTHGGSGVFATGEINIQDGSEITAVGGKSTTGTGGNGIQAWGNITVEDGADVTAIGGDSESSSGGYGFRGYNSSMLTFSNVYIENSSGDIYVRGGMGVSEEMTAIDAGDIYIANGNIRSTKANNLTTVNNAEDGENIFLLTVHTDPVKEVEISSVVTTLSTKLNGEYTYKATAQSYGTAYIWLPAGNQVISAPGYGSEAVEILNDNTAVVTLREYVELFPSLTSGTVSRDSHTSASIGFTANKAGDAYYMVVDQGAAVPAKDEIAFQGTYLGTVSGTITNQAVTLTSGAKDIYVVLKDSLKNISEPLKISVSAYSAGSTSSGGSGSSNATHTVRFETMGGTAVPSQSVSRNGKVTEPTEPTRDGYTFMGWYVDEKLTAKYNFDKAVTAAMTLYAGWEAVDEEQEPKTVIKRHAYISGYPDGTFRPDTALTRAEAASLLYNLALQDGQAGIDLLGAFVDVNESDWYYVAVGNLAGWGIINGYEDGIFKPDETITRAEFVTIAVQYADVLSVKGSSFADVTLEHWAHNAISTAVNEGFISGYPDGTFKPDASVTRAEAASILNRVTERNGISEGTTFTDIRSSHWAYEAITAAATDH